jgi:hypothetical protein
MTRGEFVFDARLSRQQPVHGGIQMILIHLLQPQQRAQGTGSSLFVEAARRSELGGRSQNARHDQSAYQIAFGTGRARQVGFETDAAQSAQCGSHVAVGQGAFNLQGLGGREQSLAFEDAAQQIDLRRGPVGKIGERAFDDFVAHARRFAQEDCGG